MPHAKLYTVATDQKPTLTSQQGPGSPMSIVSSSSRPALLIASLETASSDVDNPWAALVDALTQASGTPANQKHWHVLNSQSKPAVELHAIVQADDAPDVTTPPTIALYGVTTPPELKEKQPGVAWESLANAVTRNAFMFPLFDSAGNVTFLLDNTQPAASAAAPYTRILTYPRVIYTRGADLVVGVVTSAATFTGTNRKSAAIIQFSS